MANKKIFSYGNNGKRKIGHSKFDMGFEHVMSSNFGALHPAAVFETLPDDYWDISDNTVTLLKPMTAPAFTRINQNFYAAYVRNQQIWKYWNDYISNGTAFGDVYGNNVTNQSLQNIWDVPSIPTSYLQTILKLGCGNACPVWNLELTWIPSTMTGSYFLKGLISRITFNNMTDDVVYPISDAVSLYLQSTNVQSTDADYTIFSSLKSIGISDLCFDAHLYKHGDDYHLLFEFYCSMRQFLAVQACFSSIDTISLSHSSSIGETLPQSDLVSPTNFMNFRWRFFADRVSAEPKDSSSAFLVEKTMYLDSKSQDIKSLDFYPRVIMKNVQEFRNGFSTGNALYQCIQSPYWGFRYVLHYTPAKSWITSPNYINPTFDSSTDFHWMVETSEFGFTSSVSDLTSFFESMTGVIHYSRVSSVDPESMFDSFRSAPAVRTYVAKPSSGGSIVHSNGFGSYTTISLPSSFFQCIVYCDLKLVIPVLESASNDNFTCTKSYTSRDSAALGYDATSFITYLASNSFDLLDSFGLKVDALSQRPFCDYRFELTNALPFFAYDKIWGDNFRNSVVSSPCIDWSCANGPIFASADFYRYFVFGTDFLSPSVIPPRYNGKTYTDFTPSGWCLEIETFPRNSINNVIHTHLPISHFQHVMTFLLGMSFEFYFASLSSVQLNVFDYYLPSYYNGLLHLKYQNFNKDYFTSALLDPMSGANQVAVGSTINELRQAEVEQHWWERTAMYRSIKSWFEGTYGITPIELPEDSRITGTDHIDVQIGEVIQTSGSTPESPQGTRTGLGGCRGSGTLCHGHCNEHGWIIVLVSHTIESQYLQAYDKLWDVKESFLDYPTVDFASIGNESILQKELNYSTVPTSKFDWSYFAYSGLVSNTVASFLPLYGSASTSYRGTTNPRRGKSSTTFDYNIANAAGTSLDNVFGFAPRYSSYKFKFDQVSGQFRHELNFWHTFKRYLTNPILCHEFVNWEMAADDDDINRIFAVSDDFLDDKFAIDCFINASVDRALPFVCVPMSK